MARVVLPVLMDEAKESFRCACLEALPFIHAPCWTWCGAHLFYVVVVSLDVCEACSRLISPGLPLLFGEQRRVGVVGVFTTRFALDSVTLLLSPGVLARYLCSFLTLEASTQQQFSRTSLFWSHGVYYCSRFELGGLPCVYCGLSLGVCQLVGAFAS